MRAGLSDFIVTHVRLPVAEPESQPEGQQPEGQQPALAAMHGADHGPQSWCAQPSSHWCLPHWCQNPNLDCFYVCLSRRLFNSIIQASYFNIAPAFATPPEWDGWLTEYRALWDAAGVTIRQVPPPPARSQLTPKSDPTLYIP